MNDLVVQLALKKSQLSSVINKNGLLDCAPKKADQRQLGIKLTVVAASGGDEMSLAAGVPTKVAVTRRLGALVRAVLQSRPFDDGQIE
uniref:Uncharacterized protein n=1 Tax=Plectus sambesii TaxID=2011161 RepID=A0A914WX75_9BILA